MLINAASFDQPNLYCKWSDKNSIFEDSSPQFCFGSIDCGWGDICNTPDDTANTSSPLNSRISGDPLSTSAPAPNGSWELKFEGKITVANVDNSRDAEISQSIIMSNRAFEVTYYDYDCDELLVHSISQEAYNQIEIVGLGFLIEIESIATLNSTEVFNDDRDGIYDGDENGGNIAFCIRAEIFLDDKITSMNFVRKKVNMTVNLATANFTIMDIVTETIDAGEEDINGFDFSEAVVAYQCDPFSPGGEIIQDYQGTYSQGSLLNICVTSNNTAIDVDTITELTAFQGDKTDPSFMTHPYIQFPGEFNAQIVQLDCETYTSLINGTRRVCVAELNLLSKFFIEANPLDLRVYGKLKFVTDTGIGGGTRSRVLRDTALLLEPSCEHRKDADRTLDPSKTGSFEVFVNLSATTTTSKATHAGTKASLGLCAILGGAIHLFWLWFC
jgi:hypothetical protein